MKNIYKKCLYRVYSAALMLAAMEKHCMVVNFLLAQQADLHVQDKKGISALMYAVLSGSMVCVTALVEAVAQTDRTLLDGQVDREGNTALLHAAASGNADALSLLLLHGADPKRVNGKGQDAEALAASYDRKEIVNLLKELE